MQNIFTYMLTVKQKKEFKLLPERKITNTTLSGFLQNKIGYIMTNPDPITTKGDDIKSLNDFKDGEIGILLRYQFDNMNNLNAVPGTYIHNAIFSENPVYNLGDNPGVTIVMAKFSDDMFNSLLPGNKIDTFKTFNELDSNGNIKSFDMKNNALYCHDSNSCDGRLNQYIKLKNNTIYNSACDNSCNISPSDNKHILYSGNANQKSSTTLFCKNGEYDLYKNTCQQFASTEVLPYENCQSGNVSNGKGLHVELDFDEFKYNYNPIDPDIYLKAVNYTQNTCNDCNNCVSKNDNTLGKWSSIKYNEDYNISDKNDIYNYAMNKDLYSYSINFNNKKYIGSWIKSGTKDNNDIASIANLVLKTSLPNMIPSQIMNQCQFRLDLVIPWMDELPFFIHMQNSLYQFYYNYINLQSNDGVVISGNNKMIPCKYYWFGWNEIPLVNYPISNGGPEKNDSYLDIWSQTENGDYTIIIYLDDSYWYREFNNNCKINLQYNKKNQSVELVNFNECFLNDDGIPNKTWKYICGDEQIVKYINTFSKQTFNSCNLVFMKQVELTLPNKKAIYQKVMFDIAPSSVNNELKINDNISFKWLDSENNPLKCNGFVYFNK